MEVWRDIEQLNSGSLDKKIEAGILKSDGLLSILSPNYPLRPYCQLEMETFLDSKGSDGVILVAFRPMETEEAEALPDRIRNNIYISLYEHDQRRKSWEPFIVGFTGLGLEVKPEYWACIRAVIKEIKRIANVEARQTQARPRAYVHLATGPLSGLAARVRQELLNRGFDVAPRGDIPPTAKRLRAVAEAAAETADFAVHLLDDGDPYIPEGSKESADEIQLTATAECYKKKSKFRRFIWAGEGGRADPELVDNQRGEELISRPFEVFSGIVLRAIDEAYKEPGNKASQSVTLVKLPGCETEIVRLVAGMLDARGVAVEPMERAPGDLTELAERTNPVILCWGDSPSTDISELVANLVDNPDRRVGLFRLHPENFEQDLFRNPGLAFNATLPAANEAVVEAALAMLF